MNELDKNMYKLAVPEWCLPGDSIFSIRLASEIGLDGVQIEAGFPETGFKLSYKRVRELYLDTAKQYNIELVSIVMNDLNFHGLRNGKYTPNGKIAYDHLNIALEAAADMNIKVLMIPHFEDNDIITEEDMKNEVEALQYACDVAMKNNIIIAAETALPANDFIKLYDKVNRKNLRIFHDTQNYMCFRGFNPMDQLPAVYPYMVNQVHVKDGIDREYSSKNLGKGNSHFEEQILWLVKNNYRGWFIFENYYTKLPLRSESEDPLNLLYMDIDKLTAEIKKDTAI